MALNSRWFAFTGVVGFAVLAVMSCTDVVSPSRKLVPHPRFVEGPLPHGIVYTVGAPANNDFPAAGGVPYAYTGATVPSGTVARVYASGDLNLSLNPQCYEDPTWAGITSPVPPTGVVNKGGAVIVNFSTTLDNPTDWGSGAGYVTYLGPMSDTTPLPIMAMRNGGLGVYCSTTAPNDPPRDPPSVFAYFISGSTTLTIDILGVTVHSSVTSARPGDTVAFDAAPINFARKAEISWTFDTLAYAPQIDIVSCNNQPVCSYSPLRSGRMQVCMYDENNHPVCDESQQVTVAPWINGAPPCRAKVANYTRISLKYDSTDQYHSEPHMGQDYAAPTNTPVYSADSGTVIYADWAGTSGYAVAVRSAKPDARGLILDTYYYHLQQDSIFVRYNQAVSAGQLLARSDDSGKFPDGTKSSHGPHVHIEQHTPTPGKEAFPIKDAKGRYHNDRKTAVVPCTF